MKKTFKYSQDDENILKDVAFFNYTFYFIENKLFYIIVLAAGIACFVYRLSSKVMISLFTFATLIIITLIFDISMNRRNDKNARKYYANMVGSKLSVDEDNDEIEYRGEEKKHDKLSRCLIVYEGVNSYKMIFEKNDYIVPKSLGVDMSGMNVVSYKSMLIMVNEYKDAAEAQAKRMTWTYLAIALVVAFVSGFIEEMATTCLIFDLCLLIVIFVIILFAAQAFIPDLDAIKGE